MAELIWLFGTLDAKMAPETIMVWQLLQVGHVQGTPLILVGKMWPGVADSDEALAIIRDHHERWNRVRSLTRRAVKSRPGAS